MQIIWVTGVKKLQLSSQHFLQKTFCPSYYSETFHALSVIRIVFEIIAWRFNIVHVQSIAAELVGCVGKIIAAYLDTFAVKTYSHCLEGVEELGAHSSMVNVLTTAYLEANAADNLPPKRNN